jgi:hypothetical protein
MPLAVAELPNGPACRTGAYSRARKERLAYYVLRLDKGRRLIMRWFPLIRPSRSQKCQWWLPSPGALLGINMSLAKTSVFPWSSTRDRGHSQKAV